MSVSSKGFRPRNQGLQYGIALLALGAALGTRLGLTPLIGATGAPYFTFIIAVVFVAWICDSGPTTFSIIGGAFLAVYYFVSPHHSLLIATRGEWGNLGAYLVLGLSVLAANRGYKLSLRSLEKTLREKDLVEQMLRDESQRLRVAQQAAAAGAFEWDLATNHLRWSPELELIYGMTSGNFSGRVSDWEAFVHPDDRDQATRYITRAIGNGQGIHHEFRIVRLNGEVRWIGAHGRTVFDAAGRPEKIIGIHIDITERKHAEEQLRKSEERLRLANLAAGVATWDWDILMDRVYWSPEYFQVLGLDPTTPMLVSEWERQIHPDDRAAVGHAVRQAIKGGESEIRIECRVVGREGQVRWVHTRASVFRDNEGKAVRMLGVSVDFSDRKAVEVKLREYSQRLRSALLAGNLAGWDWDLSENELRWLSEIPALEGLAHETDREFWDRYVHPEDQNRLWEAIQTAVRDEHPFDCEFRLVRPEGGVHWLASRGDIVRDADGKPTRAVGVTFDVTERRKGEEALRVAEKFATAGRMAAALSHEINNPLEAVTNIMYLMRTDAELTSRLRELAATADRELSRVAHIVRQSLSFYREDTRPTAVALHHVADEVLALYERKIQLAGVKVETRYDFRGELPAVAGEVRQVISNLLINALDAVSEKGRIALRVAAGPNWNGKGMRVRITVADDGPGIPVELRRKIFQPFVTTKGEKGTGLGLWVSSGILHKYGGTLRVHSSTRAGKSGTCFIAYFPYQTAVAAGANERVA